MYNVFRLDEGLIRHFWGSELRYAPTEPNQDHRAGDPANALWGLLDMTPEGRGEFLSQGPIRLTAPGRTARSAVAALPSRSACAAGRDCARKPVRDRGGR